MVNHRGVDTAPSGQLFFDFPTKPSKAVKCCPIVLLFVFGDVFCTNPELP